HSSHLACIVLFNSNNELGSRQFLFDGISWKGTHQSYLEKFYSNPIFLQLFRRVQNGSLRGSPAYDCNVGLFLGGGEEVHLLLFRNLLRRCFQLCHPLRHHFHSVVRVFLDVSHLVMLVSSVPEPIAWHSENCSWRDPVLSESKSSVRLPVTVSLMVALNQFSPLNWDKIGLWWRNGYAVVR